MKNQFSGLYERSGIIPLRSLFSWSRRLIVVMLVCGFTVIQFLEQRSPTPINLPQPQTVITTNPKIGVHTRLGGIGDQAVIEQTLSLVRQMGASWIVELFPWAYIQPRSRFGYDWYGSDLIIRHAHQQGLKVIARLDIVPQWARPPGSSDRRLEPAAYQDYANFVAAFAERYAPYGVQQIVIWNEPNLAFEWGQRPPDPGAYAALLKVVYPTVKQRVPSAQILVAGLSPGPDLGDGSVRMSDIQYLASLYHAGAANYFDGVAVHTYGAKQPPEAAPAPELVNHRRVELIYQLMQSFGDGHKTLIITEGGWNDSPRWAGAVLPSQRIRWTISAYQMAETWPWLQAICLWQFQLPQATHTYHDYWTFVAPDGTPKAIYQAIQHYAVPEP